MGLSLNSTGDIAYSKIDMVIAKITTLGHTTLGTPVKGPNIAPLQKKPHSAI